MVVFAPHTTDPTKTTPRCLFQVLNDPMNSVFFILPFSKRPALLTQTSIEAQQVLQQASGYMAIEYIHLRTWIPNDVIDTPSIMLFLVINSAPYIVRLRSCRNSEVWNKQRRSKRWSHPEKKIPNQHRSRNDYGNPGSWPSTVKCKADAEDL